MNQNSISNFLHKKHGEVAIKHTAKEIKKALDKWHSDKETASIKWIWELLQNARDVANRYSKKDFEVRLFLKNNIFIFEHTSGPFTPDDVYNLINSKSEKIEEQNKNVGEFGSGFLVTHVLSSVVSVQGWVDDFGQERTFELRLERRLSDSDIETIQLISKNIEDCTKSIDKPGPSLERHITRFIYELDKQGLDVVKKGIESLKKNIIYTVSFVSPKIRITIIENNQSITYESMESVVSNYSEGYGCLKLISTNNDKCLYVLESPKLKIAIPYDSNKSMYEDVNGTSKLYYMFPLIKTHEVPLPLILDAKFRVTEDRFYIQYNELNIHEWEEILNESIKLMKCMILYSLKNNIKGYEKLLKISSVEQLNWNKNIKDIWNIVMKEYINKLIEMNIVKVLKNIDNNDFYYASPDQVYYPDTTIGEINFDDLKYLENIWGVCYYLGHNVTIKEIVKIWKDIRNCWLTFNIEIGESYTLENIVYEIEKKGLIKNLINNKLIKNENDVFKLLNFIYNTCYFIIKKHEYIPEFFNAKIYCNQMLVFDSPDNLKIDKDIPEILKDASKNVDVPLKDSLLHKNILTENNIDFFKKLNIKTFDESDAVNLIYKNILLNWKNYQNEAQIYAYIDGIITFQKWLFKNTGYLNKLDIKELPFIFQDNKLRIIPKDSYVISKNIIDENLMRHVSIWPNNAILSDKYDLKNELIEYNICKENVLYEEEKLLNIEDINDFSFKKISTNKNYTVKTKISKIVKFKEALENVKDLNSLDITKKMLEFIFDYVIVRDNLWLESEIECKLFLKPGDFPDLEKMRKFSIHPSEWYHHLRDIAWVTYESEEDGEPVVKLETPGKEYLLNHIKKLEPRLISTQQAELFLEYFGFEPLEITAWAVTKGDEQLLIDTLRVVQDVAEFQGIPPMEILNQFREELDVRKKYSELSERNRKFGFLMEEITKYLFTQLSKDDYRFSIQSNWVGFDFDAYLEKKLDPEIDYGVLDVRVMENAQTLAHFYVEVKATTSGYSRMTLLQAKTAVDNVENYLLSVVDARNLSDIIETISSSEVNLKEAKIVDRIKSNIYVTKIGEYLKPAIENFRKAEIESEDVQIDYTATFIIPSKVWKEKSPNLETWFIELIKEIKRSS